MENTARFPWNQIKRIKKLKSKKKEAGQREEAEQVGRVNIYPAATSVIRCSRRLGNRVTWRISFVCFYSIYFQFCCAFRLFRVKPYVSFSPGFPLFLGFENCRHFLPGHFQLHFNIHRIFPTSFHSNQMKIRWNDEHSSGISFKLLPFWSWTQSVSQENFLKHATLFDPSIEWLPDSDVYLAARLRGRITGISFQLTSTWKS